MAHRDGGRPQSTRLLASEDNATPGMLACKAEFNFWGHFVTVPDESIALNDLPATDPAFTFGRYTATSTMGEIL